MSLRYIFRLIQAFFRRFKIIIFIGSVLGIVVFLFVVLLLPTFSFISQKIGIVGRFTIDNLPDEVTSKITNGLTKVDESGNVIPDIAKSWETPDGGKTWVFILADKFWQDGKKINSNEIKYEFSDATIERPDLNTIKFNLDNQFSAFPIILSKPLFKKGLLGTGQWKVKDISLTGGYVQNLVIQNNKREKIIYKFYPSEARLQLAFKLGEVNIIKGIYDTSSFSNWKTLNIDKNIGYNNFVGIFLNTRNEKLSEKSVRQALDYAINKSDFNERALGPVSPLSWGYNPQVKPYDYDIEKTKEARNIEIKLSVLSNLLPIAEKVKRDWDNAGIKTEIEVVASIPQDYEAFLATIDIPKDPDQYSLWHSTQVDTNISKYSNPRIDKLLEDGRTEIDQEIRKKIYYDFQRYLVEDVPTIFLYHPVYYTITRK